MMNYSAILVDDEIINSHILQYEIEQLKLACQIEIIGSYTDPLQAIESINAHRPDILFLDIEMPQMSGFELLNRINPNLHTKVIFVTAYNDYALKAFEYHAIDYLLKPVNPNRLAETLNQFASSNQYYNLKEFQQIKDFIERKLDRPTNIVIPIQDGFEKLQIQDIIRCEADRNYSTIYLQSGRSLYVSKSLVYFERLLCPLDFLRIHQSHLINSNYVKQFSKRDGGYCIMSDQSKIPVSRNRKSELISYFKNKLI